MGSVGRLGDDRAARRPRPGRAWFAGAAAVSVLWSTQLLGSLLVGFDLLGERPLSYLARHDRSAALFTVGLCLGAVLFLVFHHEVRRRFATSFGFSAAFVSGMLGQFVAGVLPIGGTGLGARVHVAAALWLGASIPLLLWRFAAAQPPGRWRRRCYRLFALEALACGVGVALSRAHVAPLAEILPAVAFHAWVLVLTVEGYARSTFRAERAALAPPMPCTPPPGGVAAEQMNVPGMPVA